MPMATSLWFAAAARRVAAEARACGLAVPEFRSPPRLPGTRRSLRRRPDGATVVAVQLRGREVLEVAADMVEGVLAANPHLGKAAQRQREQLIAVALAEASTSAA